MSDRERDDVVKRLTEHRDRIQDLMVLIANKTSLPLEVKTEARERMRALKEALKADHKQGALVKNAAEANRFERAYLYPAVHQASTVFRSRWNSDPIRSGWYSELYEARIDIEFPLRSLEEAKSA
jgi:hypothetical protein